MRRYKLLLTIITVAVALVLNTNQTHAQTQQKARQILDKTASTLNRKGGLTANFSMAAANAGTVSGVISIKGNKFYASTEQAKTWFNGKTQWTYLTKANEVSVATPTKEQQAKMNPYRFITMYKTGYTMTYKQKGNNYEVHLVASKGNNGVKEMYITINKTNYLPSQIKVNEKGKWSTITIKNYKLDTVPDARFVFNKKDFPKAEIIDLR